MKIQVIGYEYPKVKFTNMQYSPFGAPLSLDEFDVNVIDLSRIEIWKNDSNDTKSVWAIKDFRSIRTMVCNKKASKILYVLPQNAKFEYDFRPNEGRYHKSIVLKDMLKDLTECIIPHILPPRTENISLVYEITKTKIGDKEFSATFYFQSKDEVLTKSNLSDKSTTICFKSRINDVYLTTLNITEKEDDTNTFIDYLFRQNEFGQKPDWLDDIIFGDDLDQHDIITKNAEIIEKAQEKIEIARDALSKNDWYKSILYKTGDDLVIVIFDILEQILKCNLSEFIDKKEEDFSIEKAQCTFVGEIKGISSNVKSQNVSQVENNRQLYNDALREKGKDERTKPLLIINPFRTKNLIDREPINEKQITLAKDYGCLIIETSTLLWIFDNFKKRKISSDQCINVFSNVTGLLSKKDFKLEA